MKRTARSNRILSFLLALLLLALSVPTAFAAKTVDSGYCGEHIIWETDDGPIESYYTDLKWTLDSKGTLTISGDGDMRDFEEDEYPFAHMAPRALVIEEGVTSIGSNAFRKCKKLVSVKLPGTLTKISEYAFANCVNLKEITVPDSVKQIEEGAFYFCKKLKSVVLPNKLKTISDCMFYYCTGLTAVTIPDSVKTIGELAFYNCESLPSITIPNGVTKIKDCAFELCESFTTVKIPASVKQFGGGVFFECYGLKCIKVDPRNKSLASDLFGCLYNKDYTKLFHYPIGRDETMFSIPCSVKIIGVGAFASAKLTSVSIPNGVTKIGNYAFSGSSLSSVTLPKSVEKIGAWAFYCCEKLTSINIQNHVKAIGKGAFDNCEVLKTVNYTGSEADWAKIRIAKENDCLTQAAITFDAPPAQPAAGCSLLDRIFPW